MDCANYRRRYCKMTRLASIVSQYVNANVTFFQACLIEGVLKLKYTYVGNVYAFKKLTTHDEQTGNNTVTLVRKSTCKHLVFFESGHLRDPVGIQW